MQKNIRVLIVEDEFITMDMLRDYLEQSGYDVSGDAMRADEAIDILERFDTDIAMLDINLKGEKDGIWVAEQIRQHYHIPFIFLSAYSDGPTIQRAANTNPYGYLVKPFSQADIFAAIEVALKNYAKEVRPLELPEQNWADGDELLINQFIFVKDNNSFKKIVIADIRYIQAYKNYIELHLQSQRIVIRSTLQRFTNILPQKFFVLIHRSFVVNVKFVDEINPDSVTIGNEKIPLSKGHKDDFVKKFNFFI
jgi:DNA-binding LytR/AlgR family response regulator